MAKEKYLKPVTRSITINVPTEKVWEIISKPGNLELCHPFCKSNPVEKWGGKGSIDYVNYYNGLKYKRIFTNWIDGIGYDLLIGVKFGKQSKVIWRINKIDNSSSELTITIYPYILTQYSKLLLPVIYRCFISPMLGKYLSSVLQGFKFYIIERKPVKKNQFGTHKWFSTK